MKLNSGLDRGRHRGARPGEELVAICRIQRPNVAGFIKRDELILAGELAPELEIQEGIGSPLIGADVFAERLLVHRGHTRGLGGESKRHCEKKQAGRCADHAANTAHLRLL